MRARKQPLLDVLGAGTTLGVAGSMKLAPVLPLRKKSRTRRGVEAFVRLLGGKKLTYSNRSPARSAKPSAPRSVTTSSGTIDACAAWMGDEAPTLPATRRKAQRNTNRNKKNPFLSTPVPETWRPAAPESPPPALPLPNVPELPRFPTVALTLDPPDVLRTPLYPGALPTLTAEPASHESTTPADLIALEQAKVPLTYDLANKDNNTLAADSFPPEDGVAFEPYHDLVADESLARPPSMGELGFANAEIVPADRLNAELTADLDELPETELGNVNEKPDNKRPASDLAPTEQVEQTRIQQGVTHRSTRVTPAAHPSTSSL